MGEGVEVSVLKGHGGGGPSGLLSFALVGMPGGGQD